MPVYTAPREALAALTGYTLTRGVLCAMRRPQLPSPEAITEGARRVAVIDSVTDTTNIGAIFRSAAAIGVDAVLLTPTSCDPSTVVPCVCRWARCFSCRGPISLLDRSPVSSATSVLNRWPWPLPTAPCLSIGLPPLREEPRPAMILGTEGDGLAADVIQSADYTARIPMAHGVDSLNVAAASALAFWELRCR